MVTPPRSMKQGIALRTWLAAAVLVLAVFVALVLPMRGECRAGWFHWNHGTATAPNMACGQPPPEDDWGYFPRSLLALKIAIGVGGALLARAVVMAGRRRRGVAGTEAAFALLVVGLGVVVTLHASVEERTGQVASTLRCLDLGCEGMTVEQAIMRERSRGARFRLAQHAWNAVWRGLQNEDISADAIRDRLVEKYGDQILLDSPTAENG